jgi:hypothetical protein
VACPRGSEAERAKVVHAEDVVGVAVGVEHGVDGRMFSRTACAWKSWPVSMMTLWLL